MDALLGLGICHVHIATCRRRRLVPGALAPATLGARPLQGVHGVDAHTRKGCLQTSSVTVRLGPPAAGLCQQVAGRHQFPLNAAAVQQQQQLLSQQSTCGRRSSCSWCRLPCHCRICLAAGLKCCCTEHERGPTVVSCSDQSLQMSLSKSVPSHQVLHPSPTHTGHEPAPPVAAAVKA